MEARHGGGGQVKHTHDPEHIPRFNNQDNYRSDARLLDLNSLASEARARIGRNTGEGIFRVLGVFAELLN